jgi:staphylococcal nuclease domain-containing protein 1
LFADVSLVKGQFGTILVGKRKDLSQVLVSGGLAVTPRHNDDEKSPRYNKLFAAEALVAKAAKKGIHLDKEFKKGTINDLTDPRKAKSYSGSLMHAGSLKAIVEFVFNGGCFNLLIPSKNCYIVFTPDCLCCPQPSSNP